MPPTVLSLFKQKLKEALNLIDLDVDFDVPKNPEVHATLNES